MPNKEFYSSEEAEGFQEGLKVGGDIDSTLVWDTEKTMWVVEWNENDKQ